MPAVGLLEVVDCHRIEHGLGLGGCQIRVDDKRGSIGLAAVFGEAQHREIVRRHTAIAQVDR